jgi:S1-C subfamily serine protease
VQDGLAEWFWYIFRLQTWLLGSGHIGVNRELQESACARYYLVRELRSGLPAEKVGLKVGDRVVACNSALLSSVSSEREAKRLCWGEGGGAEAWVVSSLVDEITFDYLVQRTN